MTAHEQQIELAILDGIADSFEGPVPDYLNDVDAIRRVCKKHNLISIGGPAERCEKLLRHANRWNE